MKTVEIKVLVDIEDVYNELSCADKEEFLVIHATDIAGELGTIAANWFNDCEVKEFVEDNIDKLSDEALINEIKNRGVEV